MKIWYVVFFTLSLTSGFAQNNLGPKLTSMASNGVSVPNVWAVQSNAAAISGLNQPAVSLGYQKHFLSDELSTQSLVFALPIKNNLFGLGIERYGFSAYREHQVRLSYVKKIPHLFALSFTTHYHQLQIEQYGSASALSVDVGIYSYLTTNFSVGFLIRNPSSQKYPHASVNLSIPTVLSFGFLYHATDKVFLSYSLDQILRGHTSLKTGLEYVLLDILSLRFGIDFKPFQQHFGFGIQSKKLKLDLASSYNSHLGYTPQISIGYEL